MSDYKIGKVKPNYDSIFEHSGLTFHIHRPVLPDGSKAGEHWQISHDGVPLQMMRLEPKTKAQAEFVRLVRRELPDRGRLLQLVEECKKLNRAEWQLG